MILFKSYLNWQIIFWLVQCSFDKSTTLQNNFRLNFLGFAHFFRKLKKLVFLFKRIFFAKISSWHVECNCDNPAEKISLKLAEVLKLYQFFQFFFLKSSTGHLEWSFDKLAELFLLKLRKNFENHNVSKFFSPNCSSGHQQFNFDNYITLLNTFCSKSEHCFLTAEKIEN